MEVVGPQCRARRVPQEAVVHAAVEAAGVGDRQAPVALQDDGRRFSVGTGGVDVSKGGVDVSKGGVPVLDCTCTLQQERLQVRIYSSRPLLTV